MMEAHPPSSLWMSKTLGREGPAPVQSIVSTYCVFPTVNHKLNVCLFLFFVLSWIFFVNCIWSCSLGF